MNAIRRKYHYASLSVLTKRFTQQRQMVQYEQPQPTQTFELTFVPLYQPVTHVTLNRQRYSNIE